MKSINTIICPFYVWILRKSAEMSNIFLPKEIVKYILTIAKTKPKIIAGYGGILVLNDKGIQFINSNWIKEHKIPIHNIQLISYEREHPRIITKDGVIQNCTPLFVTSDTFLKEFMKKNNISGIRKVAEATDYMIILTKCKKVISYHYDYQDHFKILFEKELFVKIYTQNNMIILLDKYGNVYTFDITSLKKFGSDHESNLKLLKELNIYGVTKISMSLKSAYLFLENGRAYLWTFGQNIYEVEGLYGPRGPRTGCRGMTGARYYADPEPFDPYKMSSVNVVKFYVCYPNIMCIDSNKKLYYNSNPVIMPPGDVVAVYFTKKYYVLLHSNGDILMMVNMMIFSEIYKLNSLAVIPD